MKEELTKEALENLSNLLIGVDASSVEVGLEILTQYNTYIPHFNRELVLLAYMPQENEQLQTRATKILNTNFSTEELQEWERVFKWVELRNILYDFEDFDFHWPSIAEHLAVLSQYKELLLKNNRYLRHYLNLGERIMEYYPKRLDVAKTFFELMLQANKKDTAALNVLGVLYKDGLRDYDKALECYNTVLSVDAKNYKALNEKANLFIDYFPQKDTDKAIEILKEAVSYYPNDYKMQVWLADALMVKNTPQTFEEGTKILESIIKTTPNRSFAWVIYGNRMWITAQKPVEAEQIYKEGIEQNPYSCVLMGNLAELYDNVHQDYEQAAKYYKEALAIHPSDSFHLTNYIALLVLELEDYVEAHLRYQDLQRLHYQTIQPEPEITAKQWAKFEKAQEKLLKMYPELANF